MSLRHWFELCAGRRNKSQTAADEIRLTPLAYLIYLVLPEIKFNTTQNVKQIGIMLRHFNPLVCLRSQEENDINSYAQLRGI